MATINYLPSFPISDRVFPCPRKHMLIYGQKPSSPPPATLTQEQLARDAGQLVEAHALLDKLCDDTDRSQHSLVHRLKQIVLGSEEMNKVLEKAGFNTAAGLLVCVQGLAKRSAHIQERVADADRQNAGYQLEITRLKERNKRLHDAQGSGCGNAAAELKVVRDILKEIANPDERGVAGMARDAVAMNLTQQGELVRLRGEAGKDPALERMVQQAHRALHDAGVSPLSGTIVERVGNLIAELDRLKSEHSTVAPNCHQILDQAGIAKGGLVQRVSSAIRQRDLFEAAHRPLQGLINDSLLLLDNAGTPGGLLPERVEALIAERDKLKISADPLLGDRVRIAHRKLNTVEQVSTFGTIDERVTSLVDLFKARVASVPLYAIPSVKLVDECVRLLDKAGIRSGNLDERVAALIRRCEHQMAAAKGVLLEDVQCHLKLNEIVEIERTGTLRERVSRVVERLKLYQPIIDNCRTYLSQACRTLGVANIEGMTTEGMAMAVSEELVRMRAAHKVAPDAAHCVKTVEECVRKLNEANIICIPLPNRIQHLLDERAAVRRDLLNLAAVTATADSNRTLAARAVNRVTTMEKTIVAFANSPSVKELL